MRTPKEEEMYEVAPGTLMQLGCRHRKPKTIACGGCFAKAVMAARDQRKALEAIKALGEESQSVGGALTRALQLAEEGLKAPDV